VSAPLHDVTNRAKDGDDEIVVTPEMIDAGEAVLDASRESGVFVSFLVARDVYIAMRRLEPPDTNSSASHVQQRPGREINYKVSLDFVQIVTHL
jgi:hypothetical protein